MINFEDIVNENKTVHNKNWPYIPDHPYRILIIRCSGSGKTNALSNLIENQPGIDKIYLRAKDYKYTRIYKNINHYHRDKENKILIVFDDMIADMIQNKKLNSVVTELFIRGRKLTISLVFIIQSCFKVPKDVRLNTNNFFIAKLLSKRELQQIAINHSSHISTDDFVNIYRKCTFVNDTTLTSDKV